MNEEINMIFCMLLIIILVVADFLEPVLEDQSRSELHACHRYAVAEQIVCQQSLACV